MCVNLQQIREIITVDALGEANTINHLLANGWVIVSTASQYLILGRPEQVAPESEERDRQGDMPVTMAGEPEQEEPELFKQSIIGLTIEHPTSP
jgi:hypothetical protein